MLNAVSSTADLGVQSWYPLLSTPREGKVFQPAMRERVDSAQTTFQKPYERMQQRVSRDMHLVLQQNSMGSSAHLGIPRRWNPRIFLAPEGKPRRDAKPEKKKAVRPEVEQDYALVQQCINGDEAAWAELFTQFHQRLLYMMKKYAKADEELAEELAARTWEHLLKNDYRALRKFDPSKDCLFSTYLFYVALDQHGRFTRSEGRRYKREQMVARSKPQYDHGTQPELFLDELRPTLTLREAEFLDWSMSPGHEGDFGNAIPQWRYKLKGKIDKHLGNE